MMAKRTPSVTSAIAPLNFTGSLRLVPPEERLEGQPNAPSNSPGAARVRECVASTQTLVKADGRDDIGRELAVAHGLFVIREISEGSDKVDDLFALLRV
jgi:hypothetical protein